VILEEGLYAHLTSDSDVTDLVSLRIYPLQVPQDVDLPAMAYQRISGPRDQSQAGPSGLVWARIQLTFLGSTYLEAKTVAGAVRGSIDGFKGTMGDVVVNACHLENEIDDWSPSFEKATVQHDYGIWYQE
jgi:hypothetical protein